MNIKEKINVIENCDKCFGNGYTGWVSPDGDFDLEWCDCNPDHLTISDFEDID